MNAKTLRRLSRLLDGALERPPAERQAWLRRAGEPLAGALQAVLERGPASCLEQLPALASGADEPTFRAGQRVGPYRLLARLGRGGSSEVWRAARRGSPARRRVVALKLARGVPAADPFADESAILASLAHPNIVGLVDAGRDTRGQPWLALECIDGPTLSAHCARLEAPLAARAGWVRQLAGALAHLHGRGIVHGDVKPANVVVSREGRAVLLDFGTARRAGEANARRAWTPGYAAPELCAGAAALPASDVYALGLVLGELLGGDPSSKQPAPRAPAARLWPIVARATREAAADRHRDAAAFADALEVALAGLP